MLSFKGVSKTFGDIEAVKNASFEIKKGEFVFITGPSGAGKTTILKLILREHVPDSGEVVFDGQKISGIPAKELPLLRQKIGVVFQDMKVLMERTVRENVEVGLAVVGVKQEEWNERVDQVLKLVGLEKRAEHFPAQLSGGELQRISLARALIVDPKLILADEPTGNLDWETTEEIMRLLEKINENGKTVIMATHNKMIIEKTSKRKIELKDGEIVKDNGKKVSSKEKPKEKSKEEIEKKEKENDDEEKNNDRGKKMKVKVEEV